MFFNGQGLKFSKSFVVISGFCFVHLISFQAILAIFFLVFTSQQEIET